MKLYLLCQIGSSDINAMHFIHGTSEYAPNCISSSSLMHYLFDKKFLLLYYIFRGNDH